MFSFSKVDGEWCIKAEPNAPAVPGQTVQVALRRGGTKNVMLGTVVRTTRYGRFFKIATNDAPAEARTGCCSACGRAFDPVPPPAPTQLFDGERAA